MLTPITFCYCNDKTDKQNYKKIIVRRGRFLFKRKNHFLWIYNPTTGKLKDKLFQYKSEEKFKAYKRVDAILNFILLFQYYTSALHDFNPVFFKPKQDMWNNIEKYPPKLKNFKEPTSFVKKEVTLRKRNKHIDEYYAKKESITASIKELNTGCKEVTS